MNQQLDVTDLGLVQYRGVALATARNIVSTLATTIIHVVLVRPEKKMIRIAARRVVAFVKHL